MEVVLVVGARPNFVKAAPLLQALRWRLGIETLLIHTGQHYDPQMSGRFFDDLGLPVPDISLGVGSGSVAEQVASTMLKLEPVLLEFRPDLVVVVGDVNATLASALVAASLGVPVAHVEAGLRSFDRRMPEEINRVVVDSLSRYLFTSCRDADENLVSEGIAKERIFFVGNIMIDSLLTYLPAARVLDHGGALGLEPRRYALLTLHRPSNVDSGEALRPILDAIREIQRMVPVVFPVHPRTEARLKATNLWEPLCDRGVLLLRPLGYLEFLSLMELAAVVLTDSGGVQEETTVLGVPCVTIRENTERPVTVRVGTNMLAGRDPAVIVRHVEAALAGRWKTGAVPELWDGRTAERIADTIQRITAGGVIEP